MPATYLCKACNATWSADREPSECPYCRSRTFEAWGQPLASVEDRYNPPGASSYPLSTVSSTSFTVAYWVGWAGIFLGSIIAVAAGNPNNRAAAKQLEPLAAVGSLIFFGSMIALFAAYIASLVKVFRGWKLIQPLRRLDWNEADMPTPGSAVGLLFVPFFNLYWFFVAYHGLAIRANKYMVRSGFDARPMSPGVAQTYCILLLCSAIPCFGLLALPVLVLFHYLFILDVDRMRGSIQGWQMGTSKAGRVVDYEAL
jgi:hypothetical protein